MFVEEHAQCKRKATLYTSETSVTDPIPWTAYTMLEHSSVFKFYILFIGVGYNFFPVWFICKHLIVLNLMICFSKIVRCVRIRFFDINLSKTKIKIGFTDIYCKTMKFPFQIHTHILYTHTLFRHASLNSH